MKRSWISKLRWIQWFNKLCFIIRNYEYLEHKVCDNFNQLNEIIETVNKRVTACRDIALAAEKVIRDRTDISVDVHQHKDNQVIVTGKYRNTDYVQVFHITNNEFKHLIEILKNMKKYGRVSTIDAAYPMKKVIQHELKFEDY